MVRSAAVLSLLLCAPFAAADRLDALDVTKLKVTDHPAAAFCRQNPQKCTCGIARERAYRDTPEGKGFIAACVGRLLGAKNGFTDCSGSSVRWRPTATYEGRKRSSEWECTCMANKKPDQVTCLRWAGVDADFGAEKAKHPFIAWSVSKLDASDGRTTERCRHGGLPNERACTFGTSMDDDDVAAYDFLPATTGRHGRATTGSPGEAPDAASYKEDRDNSDPDDVTHQGVRYLRKGEWLIWGSGGKRGWARGSYAWERVNDRDVARRSGTWRYWENDGKPQSVGELFTVGPWKRSLMRGTWTVSSDNGRYMEQPYKVLRDPARDRFVSVQNGLARLYASSVLNAIGAGGVLEAAVVNSEEKSLTLETAQGQKTLERFSTRDWVMLGAGGRPTRYVQYAWNSILRKWLQHGVEVTWGQGRVTEITDWAWSVPVSSWRYAPSGLAQLPWPEGSVERTTYGLLTEHDDAVQACRDRGAWAVVEPDADELATGNFFPAIAREDWLGVASPLEEYRRKQPTPNASQVVCESDAECQPGETCEGNACISLWEEGWRKDRVAPFLQLEDRRAYFRYEGQSCAGCSPPSEEGPWLAQATARFGPDAVLAHATCQYRVGAPNKPWQLAWRRTGGGYAPLKLEEWISEQDQGTPEARASERACFNLPLPDELPSPELQTWLSARLLGRGLDEYVKPVLEAPPPAAWAACPGEAASSDGMAWQSSVAAWVSARGEPLRACVPMLTAWSNPLVMERVNRAIRGAFTGAEGEVRTPTGTDLVGQVGLAARGLFGLTLKVESQSAVRRTVRLAWDMERGQAVRFEDAFAPGLRGKALLALARKAAPDTFKAAAAGCAAAWGAGDDKRTPTFGLGGTPDAPTVFLGESFPQNAGAPSRCDWWVELPVSELSPKLAEKSPLKRLL
ncbi:MAG: hypothetical protein RL653_876 [Pseudomonadota bacterium]|jgi:hypothetical protein